MKKILFLASFLAFPAFLIAQPMGGPAGVFIQSRDTEQPNARFNVSSGTVQELHTSTVTIYELLDGVGNSKFLTTDSDGKVILEEVVGGIGGGGASSLQVSTDGTQVSSPTATVNFIEDFTGNESPTGTANISLSTWVVRVANDASTNNTLIFNGSEWVAVPAGTSFVFSINTFTDGTSGTVEIGTGVWKAAGAMSFTATYANGPPTSSTVTLSGWSALPMDGGGLGPTVSVEAVNHPASPGGTRVFTLSASKGAESDTRNLTKTFINRRYWGISTTTSGYDEDDVKGLAGTELSNSKAKTFSVNPGAGEYIIYAYPSRLGTATFSVGGFEGGFTSPETVSVTNAFEFTENYYVYRSVNSNLGSTTVVAQ